MITRIAIIPGILVVGGLAYFLDLDVWVTMGTGLLVAIVVLLADAIRDHRQRAKHT
ncbi:hypothetical protein [Cryobacterium sp. Y62]|uniref:hypothetical protein n=1 Tax=Cryobacterium sp. Y62 TaxID=2048284 RepID=UPI0013048892|nr:hypothetical protein [Cryobacterium sp. Y62]